MAPTATANDDKRFTVAGTFTGVELAMIDYVARRLNAAAPKRTEALRHLVLLGWPEFRQRNADVQAPPDPAPPAPSETSMSE